MNMDVNDIIALCDKMRVGCKKHIAEFDGDKPSIHRNGFKTPMLTHVWRTLRSRVVIEIHYLEDFLRDQIDDDCI